jgi:hypothetical protein
MKKTYIFCILLIFSAFTFFACQEEGEMQPPPKVVVTDTVMTVNVNLKYNPDWAPVEQKVDSVGICRFLGLSLVQFRKNLEVLNTGKVKYYAIKPDLTIDETPSTANPNGHWFDAAGGVCKWDVGKLYSEYGENEWTFYIGSNPDNTGKGQSYTIRQAFCFGPDELTVFRAICVFNVSLTK